MRTTARSGEANTLDLAGRAIRWRAPLALVVAAPLVAAGLWVLDRQSDVYEAVTVLSVAPRPDEPTSADILRLAAQRHAVVLGSGRTQDAVGRTTGIPSDDLAAHVDVSVPTDTANIRVVVRLGSASDAAQVANAYGSIGESQEFADQLTATLVTSAAGVPQHPAFPPRTTFLVLLVLVAVGIGLAVAMLVERLRARLRTTADVEAALGAAVLGLIPQAAWAVHPPATAMYVDRVGSASRALRTRFLAHRTAAGSPQTIALTATEPGTHDGTVPALLGRALAEAGVRTALVDVGAGVRPLVERLVMDPARFEERPAVGIPGCTRTDFMGGTLTVLAAERRARLEHPSAAVPKLLSSAGASAEVVLLDAPALPDDVMRSAMVGHVEAAVLVVARGSSADACRLAAGQLAELGVTVLGAVVVVRPTGRWRRAPGRGVPRPSPRDAVAT